MPTRTRTTPRVGARSRVTSKAQITVPKVVREDLALLPGDELEWTHDASGYRVRKVVDPARLEKWRGYLKHLKGVDIDAMIDEMRGR